MNSILRIDNIGPAKGAKKEKTRKGRGASSKGRSCGRGRGGSGHRAGLSKKMSFEGGQMPLSRRLPKRGFSNEPFREDVQVVNLKQIQDKFSSGDKVSPESLKQKGLIKGKTKFTVKILANGDIKKKVSISGCNMSATAREKIITAGGTIDA